MTGTTGLQRNTGASPQWRSGISARPQFHQHNVFTNQDKSWISIIFHFSLLKLRTSNSSHPLKCTSLQQSHWKQHQPENHSHQPNRSDTPTFTHLRLSKPTDECNQMNVSNFMVNTSVRWFSGRAKQFIKKWKWNTWCLTTANGANVNRWIQEQFSNRSTE